MPTFCGNGNLDLAKKYKYDEFFTLMEDVQSELAHYENQFQGKSIYCNCDHPFESNFVKYFRENFNRLGLKKLVSTCMARQGQKAYKAVWENGNETLDELKSDGDFRSAECRKLLNECDIVVTNPPFSLWREFCDLIHRYKKDMLVLGNLNTVSCAKVTSPLLFDGWLKLGITHRGGGVTFFAKAERSQMRNPACWFKDDKGRLCTTIANVRWFTTLAVPYVPPKMILTQPYTPEKYPFYDNYYAINVDRVKEIPRDYRGVIGVPITFLDHWNPEQFELLGTTRRHKGQCRSKVYTREDTKHYGDLNTAGVLKVNGKYLLKYTRLLIRRKDLPPPEVKATVTVKMRRGRFLILPHP